MMAKEKLGDRIEDPNDGTRWVKQKRRQVHVLNVGNCALGLESSFGACYEPCAMELILQIEGEGFGPIVIGLCPADNVISGILYLQKGEECSDLAKGMDEDILGAITVAYDAIDEDKKMSGSASDLFIKIIDLLNQSHKSKM